MIPTDGQARSKPQKRQPIRRRTGIGVRRRHLPHFSAGNADAYRSPPAGSACPAIADPAARHRTPAMNARFSMRRLPSKPEKAGKGDRLLFQGILGKVACPLFRPHFRPKNPHAAFGGEAKNGSSPKELSLARARVSAKQYRARCCAPRMHVGILVLLPSVSIRSTRVAGYGVELAPVEARSFCGARIHWADRPDA
jgi:hypothetical protein